MSGARRVEGGAYRGWDASLDPQKNACQQGGLWFREQSKDHFVRVPAEGIEVMEERIAGGRGDSVAFLDSHQGVDASASKEITVGEALESWRGLEAPPQDHFVAVAPVREGIGTG